MRLKSVYIYFLLLDVTTHSFLPLSLSRCLITSSAVPFFSFTHPAHSQPATLLSLPLSLYLYTLSLLLFPAFTTSPPPMLPPAGCKMDSPQSESSGEGQKAEENGAQGELQRGRRHSTLLRPLYLLSRSSTF